MLVLSRKVGESIVIDGGIVVTVNRVAGQRVSLGITAPSKIHIVRGELAVNAADVEDELASHAMTENRGLLACG